MTLDKLPLFASDTQLAAALLGKDASRWRDVVDLYEARGFPKIDPLMGGRYVPAVKAFFDYEYRLSQSAPARPPGVEGELLWRKDQRRQASNTGRAKIHPINRTG